MTIKHAIRTHVRWMIRRDMAEVLAIDAASGMPALPSSREGDREEGYLAMLRVKNCIGMVAEDCWRGPGNEKVVGLMVYELHPKHLGVLRLAVDPAYRRMEVGTQMVARLASKLRSHRRTRLVADVSEYATAGQLFLRACGWRAEKVLRGGGEGGEDAYRMVCRLREGDDDAD
jgi:ribosomal-protein-alanine N-acetyltransferase